MGCCGAFVAECDGSIDGTPNDWMAYTEAEEDAIREKVVHHAWYLDTGEPAPSEYSRTENPAHCRCEAAGRP
jgi:hypothetical protein